ncbi:MAG: class I SAM-dependent methyltransferase [Leptospirales bacterium]
MEGIGKVNDRLYGTQKEFFRKAYQSGQVGWPRAGPSRLVLEAVSRRLIPPKAAVLEIGCGEGRNLLPLLDHQCRVAGMDYLIEPLESGRNHGAGEIPFVQGDLFSMPFREDCFDAVLDWGVFHHLKKRERNLYPGWISPILKPGGVFLLGAFSEQFRHSPEEKRSRMFTCHRGHYDVFFDRKEFRQAMGDGWSLVWEGEEDQGDGLSFYRIGVFRKE